MAPGGPAGGHSQIRIEGRKVAKLGRNWAIPGCYGPFLGRSPRFRWRRIRFIHKGKQGFVKGGLQSINHLTVTRMTRTRHSCRIYSLMMEECYSGWQDTNVSNSGEVARGHLSGMAHDHASLRFGRVAPAKVPIL